MFLNIVLPHEILLSQKDVRRIVVESRHGSFGLLPRRLDCAMPLSSGILVFEIEQGEQYVAIGPGVLTKVGDHVSVAVSHAMHSYDLKTVKQMAYVQFLKEEERQKEVRTALAKLEMAFARNFLELKRYG